jgi:hypothetical protein
LTLATVTYCVGHQPLSNSVTGLGHLTLPRHTYLVRTCSHRASTSLLNRDELQQPCPAQVQLFTLGTFAHSLLADKDPQARENLSRWAGPIKRIIVLDIKKNPQKPPTFLISASPMKSRISTPSPGSGRMALRSCTTQPSGAGSFSKPGKH